MNKTVSASLLGTESIPKLLVKQAVPASVGILVMSLNILIDTIFVGQWIGPNAIAAINVVLPVSFFIAALGMAIGIGGGSIISRALGNQNCNLALKAFGNMVTLTGLLTVSFVVFGLLYMETLVPAFGGRGLLYEPAKIYYTIVLYGVPVLGFCMMGNNVIRAEGKPKYAMYAMLLPSVSNLVLDYVFINLMDMGMYGAAWATTLSYGVCGLYILYFFLSKTSELQLSWPDFILEAKTVKEIGSLGFVTLSRQAMVSVTVLLVNNILFNLGGEASVATYAIISRMLMFATFPILGITQGFLPIAGYNYGAKNYARVLEVLRVSILYATILATFVLALILVFSNGIVSVFTSDTSVYSETPGAMRWVFAATPIIGIQLIGAGYFQAVGKAVPALLLTLTRQGFFFVPLLFLLPISFGTLGVWLSFPVSEVFATIVTALFLKREIQKNLKG